MVGRAIRLCSLLVLSVFATGCQSGQPEAGRRLLAHVALIDFTGLSAARTMPEIDVQASTPTSWKILPPQSGTLYTHQQWRSPSHATGVGVVQIHLPLPMSPKTLLWLAKSHYSDHGGSGELQSQWTDLLGREWFEAETDKYHIKGYAVTSGFDAWVVYSGYKHATIPNPAELDIALRSMDSVVPLPLLKAGKASTRPAN